MPEIKLFYRNCNCCSGSGSSGSGTGSGSSCDCTFLTDGFDAPMRCNGSPVVTNCKKNFVVNITLNFSGCGSSPLGSCGSGSGGGPSTGGDFTGSGSDCHVCPSCCELIPRTFQLGLECIGDTLATSNLIDGNCGSSTDFETGSTCLGPRSDKCTYFWIGVFGSSFGGAFFFPLDNWGLAGSVNLWNIDSCNPFQMSGTLFFGRAGAPMDEPCLAACLGREVGVWLGLGSGLDPGCITGSFVITEA